MNMPAVTLTVANIDNASFDALLEAAAAEIDRVGREAQALANDYQEAVRAVQSDFRARSKSVVTRYSAARDVAVRIVECNRHQFEKPRTREMFGVKIGLRNTRERCVFEFDDQFTIELIDNTLPPELALVVAPVTRDIMLEPIKKLTDKQRKDLGVSLVSGESTVASHDADSAIAKLRELAS